MNDLMFLEIQDFSREQIKSVFNRVDSHGIVEAKTITRFCPGGNIALSVRGITGWLDEGFSLITL